MKHQKNATGHLKLLSSSWVFLSHLCLWSWLCHVNHQSLKMHLSSPMGILCVLDATVFGLGEDWPWRHVQPLGSAPTWYWFSQSWIWTKPRFLTNNIHVVVTSWNIFQHLNKQIAMNFRWFFGSVGLDHWADFFPIDGLRDFLFTFTFHHCILKQISLFWMGNLCTKKSDSSFLRVLWGDPKQC